MCAHSRYNLTWWVIMDDSNHQAASFLGFLAPPSVFFLSLAPRFCDFSGSVPLISRSITVRSVLHLLCNSVDVRDLIKSVYRIFHKYILFLWVWFTWRTSRIWIVVHVESFVWCYHKHFQCPFQFHWAYKWEIGLHLLCISCSSAYCLRFRIIPG